jgi:hypothetical protein
MARTGGQDGRDSRRKGKGYIMYAGKDVSQDGYIKHVIPYVVLEVVAHYLRQLQDSPKRTVVFLFYLLSFYLR